MASRRYELVNYTDPTGHKRNDLSGQRMMSETPTNCSYAMSCSAGDAAYWAGLGYAIPMSGTDVSRAGFDAWITMLGSKLQAAESDRRAEAQAKAEKAKDPARSSADTGNEVAKSENAVAGDQYQPEQGVQEKIDVADAYDHTWDHEQNPNAQSEFNTSDAAVVGLSLAPLVGVATLAEWQSLALRIRMYFAPPAAAVPTLMKAPQGKMLGEAIGYVKNLSGPAAQKAELFQALAAQITKASSGSWSAVRGVASDGAHVFLGGAGEALVISPAGQLFRGSLQSGAIQMGEGMQFVLNYGKLVGL